jgi:hypothetical protein
MSNSTKKTSAYYKDAIEKLEQYLALETDVDNRKEAAAKIGQYRFKIIDEAFDRIAKRTQRLTTLMYDLQAIIANASNTNTLSDVIGGLKDIVHETSVIVNPPDNNGDT